MSTKPPISNPLALPAAGRLEEYMIPRSAERQRLGWLAEDLRNAKANLGALRVEADLSANKQPDFELDEQLEAARIRVAACRRAYEQCRNRLTGM